MGIVEIVLAVCVALLFVMVLVMNANRYHETRSLRINTLNNIEFECKTREEGERKLRADITYELNELRDCVNRILEAPRFPMPDGRTEALLLKLIDELDLKVHDNKIIPKDQNWVFIEEDK